MPCAENIVADSIPLIGLARIGLLGLLPRLARRVFVPQAVWVEVTSVRADAAGASEVAAQSWIEVVEVDSKAVAPLAILVGRREAEAIALAQREGSAVLLMDDLRARRLAERLGLRRMGTVALLGLAKREGLIPKPSLDALVANGLFIRRELIAAALKEVGEEG